VNGSFFFFHIPHNAIGGKQKFGRLCDPFGKEKTLWVEDRCPPPIFLALLLHHVALHDVEKMAVSYCYVYVAAKAGLTRRLESFL